MFKYGLPILQIVFIILKILDLLTIGWGLVFIPLYIYIAINIIIFTIGIAACVADELSRKK